MLKCIQGWLRRLFRRAPKRALRKEIVEWDLVPFSFAIDWCVSTDELLAQQIESLGRVKAALKEAVKGSERGLP